MPTILYGQDGSEFNLSDQMLQEALDEGRWLDPKSTINVRTNEGLFSVPFTRENLLLAIENKDEIESPEEAKKRQITKEIEDTSSLITGPAAALRSAVKGTFIVDPVGAAIDKIYGKGATEALEEKHDIISPIAEYGTGVAAAMATGGASAAAKGGAVAATKSGLLGGVKSALSKTPVGMIEKATQGAIDTMNASKIGLFANHEIINEGVARAAEGVAISLISDYGESVMNNKELLGEYALSNAAMGFIFGGAGGLVGGSIGQIGKGANKAMDTTGDALNKGGDILEHAFETAEGVADKIGPQLKKGKQWLKDKNPEIAEMVTGRPASETRYIEKEGERLERLTKDTARIDNHVKPLRADTDQFMREVGFLDKKQNIDRIADFEDQLRKRPPQDESQIRKSYEVIGAKSLELKERLGPLSELQGNYANAPGVKNSIKSLDGMIEDLHNRTVSGEAIDQIAEAYKVGKRAVEAVDDSLSKLDHKVEMGLGLTDPEDSARVVLKKAKQDLLEFIGDEEIFGDVARKQKAIAKAQSEALTSEFGDDRMSGMFGYHDKNYRFKLKFDKGKEVRNKYTKDTVMREIVEGWGGERHGSVNDKVLGLFDWMDKNITRAGALAEATGNKEVKEALEVMKSIRNRTELRLQKIHEENHSLATGKYIEKNSELNMVKTLGSFSVGWTIGNLLGLGPVAPAIGLGLTLAMSAWDNPMAARHYARFIRRVMGASQPYTDRAKSLASDLAGYTDARLKQAGGFMKQAGASTKAKGIAVEKSMRKAGSNVSRTSPLLNDHAELSDRMQGISQRANAIFEEKFKTLNEIDPGMGSAIKTQMRTIFQELEKAAPKPNSGELLGNNKVYQSLGQQNEFANKVNLAINPSHIFTLIKNGQISKEYVRFFAKIYPNHYKQLANELLANIDTYKATPQTRAMLSIMLGYPVSNSLANIRQGQDLLKKQKEAQKQVPKMKAININAKAYATDSQLLENKGV